MLRYNSRVFFLLMAAIAIALAVIVPRVRVRLGSLEKSARLRAMSVPLDDPDFRIAVVFDSPTGKVRVIAIERYSPSTVDQSMHPSFCNVEIDRERGSATMYVEGRAIIPNSELVVFMAEYGAKPIRVVISRDDYDRIAEGGVLPAWSDLELWELCQRVVREANAHDLVRENKG